MMPTRLVRAFASLIVLCIAVTQAAIAAQGPDTITARMSTHADPAQQYSLYLPPDYATTRRWPVLVILDARGRGEQTARLALPGARANGWIVLSSYQSRSDTNEIVTLQAMQALLREALSQYPADPKRIYLAGLSGTAKTLWTRMEALDPLLAGVIGCGGGRPPELGPLHKPAPAFLGVAGTRDFNYEEMRDLDADLAAVGATHRLLVFSGVHGWPQPDVFADGIGWLELMAMRDGRTAPREAWIDARFAADRAQSLSATGLERLRRLEQMVSDYRGLRDVNALQAEVDSLARQPDVVAQRALERRLHDEESDATRRLDAWIARVGTRDAEGHRALSEASSELRIGALKRMLLDANPAISDSAHRRIERILAFTTFYLPEQLVAHGEASRAIALLEFSMVVDPAQPTVLWRIAQLQAGLGRKDEAFKALQAARAQGYLDADDIQRNPLWNALRADPRWHSVAAPP